MIFYFSGTGNSLFIAKGIAEAQGDKLISIAQAFEDADFEYECKPNELLGFVFPVYAWAPPRIVMDFVSRLQISGESPYIFSVCTCGDEEGRTTPVLQKALEEKGLVLDSAFTVAMPNNYILMFNVDKKELEQDKLNQATQKLKVINSTLSKREGGIFDLLPGSLPYLKTAIINPLFNRFARSTKGFYATDACTRCGTCEKICPVHTIRVENKPVWGEGCTQCLACIHRCPVHAIQYGKGTIHKGRYVHPDLKAESVQTGKNG